MKLKCFTCCCGFSKLSEKRETYSELTKSPICQSCCEWYPCFHSWSSAVILHLLARVIFKTINVVTSFSAQHLLMHSSSWDKIKSSNMAHTALPELAGASPAGSPLLTGIQPCWLFSALQPPSSVLAMTFSELVTPLGTSFHKTSQDTPRPPIFFLTETVLFSFSNFHRFYLFHVCFPTLHAYSVYHNIVNNIDF